MRMHTFLVVGAGFDALAVGFFVVALAGVFLGAGLLYDECTRA